MTAKAEQKITQYLYEAHAAEGMLAHTLAAHIAMTPASRYRNGLEAHLQETIDHAERIERHLARRESSRGAMQVGFGVAQGVVGQVLAMGKFPLDLVRGMSGEEKVLKNAKDECATEAQEIATYIAIEELALAVGDNETARLAASIRKDEEAMLARLLEELPILARDVALAEVDGDPQFVLGRIGAADAARTVATAAARTVATSARRAARRSERAGAGTSKTSRTPRKDSVVRSTKPAARTKTTVKAGSTPKRHTASKTTTSKAGAAGKRGSASSKKSTTRSTAK